MRKLFCGILAVLMTITAITISGCSDNGLDAVLMIDISENPKTLDPQQANDSNSVQIVLNVFMGLMRYGMDGSVQCGTAESYTKSDDDLTYNFKLREDVFWTNCEGFEKQCTAKDYVFGFRRLFSRTTKAPRASEYFCIKNSEELNNGKIITDNYFGVKAISDFELEITLDYANPRFLQLLCEAPAMPCNEEFFDSTRGKYGLSAECTASNGAFYVRKWNFDPYASTDVNNVILSRNSKNADVFGVCPSSVRFFIEDEEDFIGDFLSGETNIIALANKDKSKIVGNYNCEEFSSITVGLTFNESYSLFESLDFRKALALSIPRENMNGALKDFEAAGGIVPKRTSIFGQNYREKAGLCKIPDYNADEAAAYFKAAKSSIDTTLLRGARIITKSSDAHTAAQYIMQEWQRIGFYCQLELLSESEFNRRIANGAYEIAVTELTGGYDSPAAYLEQISAELLQEDISSLLDSAYIAENDGVGIYFAIEQIFINNAVFIPLYYKNEYFFTDKDIYDVIYNPFTKTIDFSHGKMK
ncbi:MAG: peptide ABC transporter substrate-binding protein [Oscillospiraceae bacterium]|nr:peptide ABC transporter substrate-binding protein [Oscillospiraceae bacterium]